VRSEKNDAVLLLPKASVIRVQEGQHLFKLSSKMKWHVFRHRVCYAGFPPFCCRSSVAVSPFCRCKIPLFCKIYVRKFRSVSAVNSRKIRNGNGVPKRQRLTATAKWQRKNGNGMVETGH